MVFGVFEVVPEKVVPNILLCPAREYEYTS